MKYTLFLLAVLFIMIGCKKKEQTCFTCKYIADTNNGAGGGILITIPKYQPDTTICDGSVTNKSYYYHNSAGDTAITMTCK